MHSPHGVKLIGKKLKADGRGHPVYKNPDR